MESDIPQLNYNIIRAEQIADADLAEKINFLQNGITNGKTPERMRAETKGYELDGTSLLRLKPKGSCPARICIPDTLKTNIIQLAHDNSTSMHLGFHKTWKRVANVAYWKYLKNDVMQYVKNCEDCAISKHYGATLQSSLTPLPVPTEPFQYIAADIMHMPKSNKGNQYILAFICHFSKFLITYALDSTDAKTIADKFVNDLCRWISFPKYLLTDQGSNFKADHLQAILDQYKVNKIFSVPYHHQTNGLIERSFRTLRQGFRVFCNKNPEEWDTYLTSFTLAYNSANQSAIKTSPFFVVYGREPRLPLSAAVEAPLTDLSVEQLADISGIASSANTSYAIQQRFHKIWELIRENSETAKACMKEAVDKSLNTSEADFQKGDLVILKASANPPGPNQKLTQHRGPAVILEVQFPNLIIRIRENNVVVDKTVNVSQVRKYHGKLKDEELVDTRCFVCNRYHIQTRGRKRVNWIQCETCFKWYHQQCVVIPSTLNLTTGFMAL